MTEEKFKKAVEYVRSLPPKGPFTPSNDLKLKFYAFFKQATEGTERGSQPWKVQLVARAKWDAWAKLGDMGKEEAMNGYIAALTELQPGWEDGSMELNDKVAAVAAKPGDPEPIA